MPCRVDEVGLGPAATRYAVLIALSGSTTVGHVAPYSATKSRAGAAGSSVRTPTMASPSAACSCELRGEQRELVAARHARRAPEVDDDRPAAEGGEVERRAVERGADDGRRGLADHGLRAAAASRPTNSTTPTSVTVAMASASRIGRRGVAGLAYWSVAVPVMFAWIVHTNVYVPAGSAGTS